MTYVKLAVKSIVDNFINFDNFEQSDNLRKLNKNKNVFILYFPHLIVPLPIKDGKECLYMP